MSARTVIRVAAAAALLVCSTAQAQLFRAYLSAAGSDGNPCTLPSPCRLLPAALNAVASGGEIWMLDSANYNSATVTINKSVSILAVPGVVGSIVAQNGGPALSVTAAGLNIALRNLVIGPVAGATPGTDGAVLSGASTLTIEDSLIAGVPEFGVRVDGSGVLKVANSTLRSNGKYAILLTGGGSATVSSTQMLANGWGGFSAQLSTAATSTSSISDSVISGGNDGIHMRTNTAGAVARVTVTRSTVERTSYALLSYIGGGGSATIAVSSSMIVNNNYGWYLEGSGAIIRSLGNNHFSDNTNTFGALTPVPAQ